VGHLLSTFPQCFRFRRGGRHSAVDGLHWGREAGETVAVGVFVRAFFVLLPVVGPVQVGTDFIAG
jgi:hypothetical protein